jgi:hypothetical protein
MHDCGVKGYIAAVSIIYFLGFCWEEEVKKETQEIDGEVETEKWAVKKGEGAMGKGNYICFIMYLYLLL